MPLQIVIEQSGLKDEKTGGFLCSLSEDGDYLILTKDECVSLWNEFSKHTFRRDDVDGEKAYRIFKAISNVANVEV